VVQGKKIAFVLFDYPLGVSTMLINSIALLAASNQVEVLVSRAERKALPLDPWMEPLLVTYPGFNRWLPIRALRFLLKQLGRRLRLPATLLWWTPGNVDVLLFSAWLRRRARDAGYDIVIPVEALSLIAVDRAAVPQVDVIYYNLELLDWAEDRSMHLNKPVLKALEHRALARVAHVMITSPERGRLFAELNGFPVERVSALPVAPLRQPAPRRTRFFRDKFGISDDRLLVIYSGNFEPWAQCLEIISSMDRWPANAVLVMHTWNRAVLAKRYFAQMKSAAAGRPVYFSTEYLLHDELAPALSSADVGLLFYEAIDANFIEILFSSNKMAEYMAAGVPVVCSPFPSLGAFVAAEGIGLAAEFTAVGAALARIASDLPGYREAVARCRARHFEFEPYFTAAFSAYAEGESCCRMGR
jgi:glycosyltransferase involved in cell wall biosynthesis